jgi:hypothetical protein
MISCAWSPFALAQQDQSSNKPQKVMRVHGASLRTGIVLDGGVDCADAKVEVLLKNGEATLTIKEIESGRGYSSKFDGRTIELIFANKACRISLTVSPAK